MNNIDIGVFNSKAGLVSDDQYHQVVKWLSLRSRIRIYASIFIIDILPSDESDNDNLIINLLNDLQRAFLRGVDVKLIIGGSKNNLNIQDTAESTLEYCRLLKIPCQLFSIHSEMSSHKKLLVADDRILVGSHNWSYGAFSGQIQDSILIEDKRLASYFADEIAIEWNILQKESENATV